MLMLRYLSTCRPSLAFRLSRATNCFRGLGWAVSIGAVTISPAAHSLMAGISANTYFESHQIDQVSIDPFEFDERYDGDNDMGTSFVNTSGTFSTFHQNHGYETFSGAATNYVGGRPVHMEALHRHHFELGGFDEGSLWIGAEAFIYSGVTFSDTLTLTVQGPGTPSLVSVEYVWKGSGRYTQIIDIATGQQPLYRLTERIRFSAGAGGSEDAAIDIDITIYDPDAQQPTPAMWSVLDDDVNLLNQPIPGLDDVNQTLTVKVDLQPDGLGGYLPIPLDASLSVESRHKFLNDGPSLNFFLRGESELLFTNSADMLGIIVRDETGAVRTDVIVTSAEGVVYPLLVPEPASLVLLCVGLAAVSGGRCRRRRPA